MDDALRFIRATDNEVQRGDLLGWSPETAGEASLASALLQGQCGLAKDLLLARYAAGVDLAVLCDDFICPAMKAVGELWRGGSEGVLLEHLATSVLIDALHRLRALTEAPADRLAIGGAVENDPYVLPTLMTSVVLSASGWDARDLGAGTPFEVFLEAINSLQPNLVWLAINTAEDPDRLRDGVATLLERAGPDTYEVVLGGREVSRLNLGEHSSLHLVEGMVALQGVASERSAALVAG